MAGDGIRVKGPVLFCLEEESVLWVENFPRYQSHELFKKPASVDALLGLPFQVDEFNPENALRIAVSLNDGIVGILHHEFTAHRDVAVSVEVVMLLVFDACHHMLEYLSTDLESVDLRAVLQQGCTGELRHLLKVHVLDAVSQLLVDDPEVFGEEFIALVSIVKTPEHVSQVRHEMALEDADRERRVKHLDCDPVQSKRSEFDLIEGQELAHQSLPCAFKLFIIDYEEALRQDLAVEPQDVLIVGDLRQLFRAHHHFRIELVSRVQLVEVAKLGGPVFALDVRMELEELVRTVEHAGLDLGGSFDLAVRRAVADGAAKTHHVDCQHAAFSEVCRIVNHGTLLCPFLLEVKRNDVILNDHGDLRDLSF